MAGTTTKAYDEAVVRAAALISASYLIKPYDPEQAEALEREAYDPIDGTGLLDRIRNGEIALHNEVSLRKGAGIVREVSLNASTTGQIVDTRGYASTEWDVLKVVIETGGTFTAGSASSVTYSVYEGDSTGRKTSKAVDANTITGGFDSGAGGIEIRFSPGVYTASDEWEIEISGDAPETQMGTDNVLMRRV